MTDLHERLAAMLKEAFPDASVTSHDLDYGWVGAATATFPDSGRMSVSAMEDDLGDGTVTVEWLGQHRPIAGGRAVFETRRVIENYMIPTPDGEEGS